MEKVLLTSEPGVVLTETSGEAASDEDPEVTFDFAAENQVSYHSQACRSQSRLLRYPTWNSSRAKPRLS